MTYSRGMAGAVPPGERHRPEADRCRTGHVGGAAGLAGVHLRGI